ncbi:DUF3822 family protein [Flavobacterium sp. CYK-4]|uniref:DUF3822 family protein n=1 Tax=Flavobacterium lotistagni TaxID=2709660 RepID=UPI00140C4251|nr:DUF3822 family protein [Flavobacterium lotistagni]NHM07479.1 DUF3822 family protein [Flavobacterium lotistagni]
MLVNAANITEKTYRKLTAIVSANAMVLSTVDTLNHQVLNLEELELESTGSLENALNNNAVFQERYDQVVVLHQNNLSTFVPAPLFNEQYIGSYLQYNTKVFETDAFAYDALQTYSMNTVYVPQTNVNETFEKHFKSISFKHIHTILVSRLLDLSKNVDDKRMFVHLAKTHFEIVIVQNQHLLLFNSFDYKTPEDLIYYILFTAEQLNMNPESFRLEFLGDISESDAFYQIVYKYVRNVSLFDLSDLTLNNELSTAENLKHFILLQS